MSYWFSILEIERLSEDLDELRSVSITSATRRSAHLESKHRDRKASRTSDKADEETASDLSATSRRKKGESRTHKIRKGSRAHRKETRSNPVHAERSQGVSALALSPRGSSPVTMSPRSRSDSPAVAAVAAAWSAAVPRTFTQSRDSSVSRERRSSAGSSKKVATDKTVIVDGPKSARVERSSDRSDERSGRRGSERDSSTHESKTDAEIRQSRDDIGANATEEDEDESSTESETSDEGSENSDNDGNESDEAGAKGDENPEDSSDKESKENEERNEGDEEGSKGLPIEDEVANAGAEKNGGTEGVSEATNSFEMKKEERSNDEFDGNEAEMATAVKEEIAVLKPLEEDSTTEEVIQLVEK